MKLTFKNSLNYKKVVEALNNPEESFDFSATTVGPHEHVIWIREQ